MREKQPRSAFIRLDLLAAVARVSLRVAALLASFSTHFLLQTFDDTCLIKAFIVQGQMYLTLERTCFVQGANSRGPDVALD